MAVKRERLSEQARKVRRDKRGKEKEIVIKGGGEGGVRTNG